jgi:ATP-dependent Clp protease ATP-binding subunit ClpA
MAKMANGPSAANQRIFHLAELERRRLSHPYLGDEHLLLGLLAEAESAAAGLLIERGLDLPTARADIQRIVSGMGQVGPDDATVLRDLGVDVDQMRRRLESAFGTLTVHEAERQVRRRPWWRGRARHSPLCGPVYLIKRAQLTACTVAGNQGQAEMQPEHLLYGVLRSARDPLGTGLGRRGRRDLNRLGLPAGAPHPVRVLLAERGIDLEQLCQQLKSHR